MTVDDGLHCIGPQNGANYGWPSSFGVEQDGPGSLAHLLNFGLGRTILMVCPDSTECELLACFDTVSPKVVVVKS